MEINFNTVSVRMAVKGAPHVLLAMRQEAMVLQAALPAPLVCIPCFNLLLSIALLVLGIFNNNNNNNNNNSSSSSSSNNNNNNNNNSNNNNNNNNERISRAPFLPQNEAKKPPQTNKEKKQKQQQRKTTKQNKKMVPTHCDVSCICDSQTVKRHIHCAVFVTHTSQRSYVHVAFVPCGFCFTYFPLAVKQ